MTKTKQTLIKILSVALSVVMLSAALITLSGCGPASLVEYKVTYELDGGTNNAENPETYTIDDFPLVFQDPTKDGFTFAGWTSEIHEEPEYDLTLFLGDEQNLTLTANWDPPMEPGSIRYKLGKGGKNDVSNPDKFTEDDVPLLIDGVPTREGYIFTGWTTATDKKTKKMTVTITKFGFEILTATWDKVMSEGYGNDKLLAPDFEFKDKDGKSVKLSDYRGVKPVFLSFWVTSCKYCKEEIEKVFKPIYNSSFKDEFELIVICCDPANLPDYLASNAGLKIPMYTANGGVAGYTDNSWPRNYMVDKWGYLINEDRPADIKKAPINNFDCGTLQNTGDLRKIVNSAISRANK